MCWSTTRRRRAPRRWCSTSRAPAAWASGAACGPSSCRRPRSTTWRRARASPTSSSLRRRSTTTNEPGAGPPHARLRPRGGQRRGVSRKRGGAMNNPLPVDPFSVAEAARRTWPALIEAMLEAVCLVEPEGLRIVAANGAAGRLLGLPPAELVGRDMLATAPTPEDESFWQHVADKGGCASILSDSFVTRDGQAVPVVRRVSKIEPAPGNALYVVALYDRSEQMRVEEAAALGTAELAATLESVADG